MMMISPSLVNVSAPVEGASKTQPKDLDSMQSSAFGELLKVEEKKLQEEPEGAAVSAAAVMASLQVRPMLDAAPVAEAVTADQAGTADKQPAAALNAAAPLTELQTFRTWGVQTKTGLEKGTPALQFNMPAPELPAASAAPVPAVPLTGQTVEKAGAFDQTAPVELPQTAVTTTTPSLTNALPETTRLVQKNAPLEKEKAAVDAFRQPVSVPAAANDRAAAQAAPAPTTPTPSLTGVLPETTSPVQENIPLEKGKAAVELPQPVSVPAAVNNQPAAPAAPAINTTPPPLTDALPETTRLGRDQTPLEKGRAVVEGSQPVNRPVFTVEKNDPAAPVAAPSPAPANEPAPAPVSPIQPAANAGGAEAVRATPQAGSENSTVPAGKSGQVVTADHGPALQVEPPAPLFMDVPADKAAPEKDLPKMQAVNPAPAVSVNINQAAPVPAASGLDQAAKPARSEPLPIPLQSGPHQPTPTAEAQTVVLESGVAVPIVKAGQPLPAPDETVSPAGVELRNEKMPQPAAATLFAQNQPEPKAPVVEAETRVEAVPTGQAAAEFVERPENSPSAEKPAAFQELVKNAESMPLPAAAQVEAEVKRSAARDAVMPETKLTPVEGQTVTPVNGQTVIPPEAARSTDKVERAPAAGSPAVLEAAVPAAVPALKTNVPPAGQVEPALQAQAGTADVKKSQPQSAQGSQPEETEIKPMAVPDAPVRAPAELQGFGKLSAPQSAPLAADVIGQVMSQMKVRIKGGSSTMNLKLNPRELGEIEIQMVSGPKGVSVTFLADQPGTGQLLESQMNQLRQSFKDAGIQLAGLNIGLQDQHKQEGGFSKQGQYFEGHFQRSAPQAETAVKEMERLQRAGVMSGEVDYLI